MAKNRHHSQPRSPAFSLTELAAVIAIIGILAALAIPRFANAAAHQRAEAAARRVAADLKLMQRSAKASSLPHRVRFLTNTDRYVVEYTTDGTLWIGIADSDQPARRYEVDLGMPPYEVSVVAVTSNGLVECDSFGTQRSNFGVTFRSGAQWLAMKVARDTGEITTQVAAFELSSHLK